jgi:anti-sigma factor RsiW
MIDKDDPTEWPPTKVQEWLRSVTKRYSVGGQLSDEDFSVYDRLLERHPSAKEKRGSGIRVVKVVANQFGKKALTIIRMDGTTAVAGQKTMMRKRKHSLMENLNRACRDAVRPSVVAYRDAHCGVTCVLCPDRTDLQVDHAPPNTFAVIFERWCHDNTITVASLSANEFTQRKQGPVRFANSEVAEIFRQYHDKYAVLRMLCQRCNLGVKRP